LIYLLTYLFTSHSRHPSSQWITAQLTNEGKEDQNDERWSRTESLKNSPYESPLFLSSPLSSSQINTTTDPVRFIDRKQSSERFMKVSSSFEELNDKSFLDNLDDDDGDGETDNYSDDEIMIRRLSSRSNYLNQECRINSRIGGDSAHSHHLSHSTPTNLKNVITPVSEPFTVAIKAASSKPSSTSGSNSGVCNQVEGSQREPVVGVLIATHNDATVKIPKLQQPLEQLVMIESSSSPGKCSHPGAGGSFRVLSLSRDCLFESNVDDFLQRFVLTQMFAEFANAKV
jgi:hypothetical protein